MKLVRKYIWGVDDDEEKEKHDTLIEQKAAKSSSKSKVLQVICAGHGRTGTTSLRAALNILQFPTYDMVEVSTLNDFPIWDGIIRNKLKSGLNKTVKAPLLDYTDWDQIFIKNPKDKANQTRNYIACTDAPNNFLYRELSTYYPSAKIILTTRDADKWYESCKQTIHKIAKLFESRWLLKQMTKGAPYVQRNLWNCFMLMDDEKDIDTDHGIVGFNNNKQEAMDAFNKWNNDVIEWCKDNDKELLVYQLKQGWGPLCEFLEVEIPDQEFPHSNSREEYKKIIRSLNTLCNVVNTLIFLGVIGIGVGGYYGYKKYYLNK